ncbi:MAG: hypothetical protein PHN57_04030 [Candidatus Omnitrophica bacterium]|nr:hypothetical protein [Candidatus Omnitrophota bacterium]
MPPQLNKFLFFGLSLVLLVTFYTRNNFKSVNNIMPQVLEEPYQEAVTDKREIKFTKDGYTYRLDPLYDYEISALLVSKITYKGLSIHRVASVFPADLCLIWGSNVKNKVYKNWSIRFSQDCRWCNVQWNGDVEFNQQEFSNNHLLINDRKLEAKIRSLVAGDQVTLSGKLVNVKADIAGNAKADIYNPNTLTWNTSVSRKDTGAGACEVIYVEDVTVLKKANVISSFLFILSLYGLLGLFGYNLFRFLF